jgi:hypothetical protein
MLATYQFSLMQHFRTACQKQLVLTRAYRAREKLQFGMAPSDVVLGFLAGARRNQ